VKKLLKILVLSYILFKENIKPSMNRKSLPSIPWLL